MASGPRHTERRTKQRFYIEREVRYRVLEDDQIIDAGSGKTLNMSSGGVAFLADHDLAPGALVELSISWPALLDNSCRMKLVAFGRVLRCEECRVATTIEKYEFRTQARAAADSAVTMRADYMLRRWVEGSRKDVPRVGVFSKSEAQFGHA